MQLPGTRVVSEPQRRLVGAAGADGFDTKRKDCWCFFYFRILEEAIGDLAVLTRKAGVGYRCQQERRAQQRKSRGHGRDCRHLCRSHPNTRSA